MCSWRVLGLCIAFGAGAWGDGSRVSQNTKTVVLSDFETPASIEAWTGIDHAATTDRAPSGSFAMTFDVPKWRDGEEPRPGVSLAFDGGKGFPIGDWSAYRAVAVDAWVVGDAPGKLGLKVVDGNGVDSWTTHITVRPGRRNEAILLIDDAGDDCNIHDVDRVVLYALRAENSFRLVVDNLRLLPRTEPPLAEFQLIYPNYRGLVFPDAGPLEVKTSIDAVGYGLDPDDVSLVLAWRAGKRQRKVERRVNETQRAAIGVAGMPDGPVTLTASLLKKGSRGALAQQSWDLRKPSASEIAGMKSYVDRDNNLVVDGQPFFPLGWYTNTSLPYLDEVAGGPFNCLLAYGTDRVPRQSMLEYLDAVEAAGLKLIYCLNDVYPTSTLLDDVGWEGIFENEAIADAVVNAYRDHPAILAWYLNDERPKELAPQLEDYYHRVRDADPAHPCVIVLCNKKDFKYFDHTTDILGGDTYPVPGDPVTFVSRMVDVAREAGHGAKPVWMAPQAFGWYQYNSDNKDRGHTPSEEELRTGRAPTYDEARCMTYLALIHGAKGLIYYCYYDLRLLPQYEEMWAWMRSIGNEVKTLAPVLLAHNDRGPAKVEPASAPIDTKLKSHDGRLFLMAVNASDASCTATLDVGQALPERVNLMFEDRQTAADGSRITLKFGPYGVFVVDLGPSR